MVAKQIPMTEAELAEVAECFFASKGWDLYPEAVIPNFNGRPDHLGVKMKTLTAAFEYKRSLTYPVIEQLTRWHHEMTAAINSKYMDESTKAIPHLLLAVCQRGNNGTKFAPLKQELLERYRIGYYEISKVKGVRDFRRATRDLKDKEVFCEHDKLQLWIGDCEYQFYEVIPPKIQAGSRQTAHNIIKHLNLDMKMGCAGTTGLSNAYMTPFKRTLRKVQTVLERGGEWHIDTILQVVNKELGGHHYCSDASAKNGICKFLEDQKIGIKVYDYSPTYILWTEALKDYKPKSLRSS